MSKVDHEPLPLPQKADADGVRNKWYRVNRLQSRLSGFFYGANIPRPTDAEIEAALDRLRIGPVLRGYRGRPAAAVPALVALVQRLVRGALAAGVVEVELNPVLVTTDAAVAVDALVTIETGRS